jgi:hypothetical protein
MSKLWSLSILLKRILQLSGGNGDYSYEVVVLKLSKVLENINELMAWVEQQTVSEHIYLLQMLNIKQYVLKKCSHQF